MKHFVFAFVLLAAAGRAAAEDAAVYPQPGASLGPRAVYYRADDGDTGTWNPGA